MKKSGKTWEFPVEWGNDLQTEHERFLVRRDFQKAGDRHRLSEGRSRRFTCASTTTAKPCGRWTCSCRGVGEIIGGSQREERHDVLLQRLRDSGLDEKPYWWYLDLRRYGTVPHAGFGLGLERMMMYLTGLKNIRDVIPFPRTPGNAEF